MISNYSSLIEFVSAIYLTMAVEYRFFMDIWSPQNDTSIDLLLKEKESVTENDSYICIIRDSANDMHSRIASLTNRKGGFMLSVCVLLLVFMGYETTYQSETIMLQRLQASCLIPILEAFVIMLFSNYILRKWKCVVFSTLLSFFSFMSTFMFADYIWNLYFIQWGLRYFVELILLLVFTPIIHHLLVNWLYHGVYQGYMKDKIGVAIQEYDSACNSARQTQIDNEDNDMSKAIQVLKNQMVKIATPSIWRLLFSLFLHYYEVFVCDRIIKGLEYVTSVFKKTKPNQPQKMAINDYIKKK